MRILILFLISFEFNASAVINIDSMLSSRYSRSIYDSIFFQGDILLAPEIRFDLNNGLLVEEGSLKSIQELAAFFTRNPFVVVEIVSHTDSRGNEDSNQVLSLQRSKTIIAVMLNYFSSDTVFTERFIATGKGESDPVISEELINTCKDDKINIEKYHQINRRTEIRITGFIGKNFYRNKMAAKSTIDNETRKSLSYNDLLMIADRYLLENNLEKALEFYEYASAVEPADQEYAADQVKKIKENPGKN